MVHIFFRKLLWIKQITFILRDNFFRLLLVNKALKQRRKNFDWKLLWYILWLYSSPSVYFHSFSVQIFKHGISCNMNFLLTVCAILPPFMQLASSSFCFVCVLPLHLLAVCRFAVVTVKNVESIWRLTKFYSCLTEN